MGLQTLPEKIVGGLRENDLQLLEEKPTKNNNNSAENEASHEINWGNTARESQLITFILLSLLDNGNNKEDINDNHKDSIRCDNKFKMMTTKLEIMTTKVTLVKTALTMMTTKMTVMTATLTMINDYWSGFADRVGSVRELHTFSLHLSLLKILTSKII